MLSYKRWPIRGYSRRFPNPTSLIKFRARGPVLFGQPREPGSQERAFGAARQPGRTASIHAIHIPHTSMDAIHTSYASMHASPYPWQGSCHPMMQPWGSPPNPNTPPSLCFLLARLSLCPSSLACLGWVLSSPQHYYLSLALSCLFVLVTSRAFGCGENEPPPWLFGSVWRLEGFVLLFSPESPFGVLAYPPLLSSLPVVQRLVLAAAWMCRWWLFCVFVCTLGERKTFGKVYLLSVVCALRGVRMLGDARMWFSHPMFASSVCVSIWMCYCSRGHIFFGFPFVRGMEV